MFDLTFMQDNQPLSKNPRPAIFFYLIYNSGGKARIEAIEPRIHQLLLKRPETSQVRL